MAAENKREDAAPYRVVLLGNGNMSCDGLDLLLSLPDVSVPLVVCDKSDCGRDSPQLLSDASTPFRRSLRKYARQLGFAEAAAANAQASSAADHFQPVVIAGDPNGARVLARVAAAKPHVVLSLQCRRLLRQPILSIASIATLNVHNAPLPLLRGCDPFAWAIHDGLRQFGVTLHEVDLGCDSGDVHGQLLFPVREDDTAWSLYERSLPLAAQLIRR